MRSGPTLPTALRFLLVLTPLPLAGCILDVTKGTDPFQDLHPGMRVEVKGSADRDPPVIDSLREIVPKPSDRPVKAELTAKAGAAGEGSIEMLGREILVGPKTVYENRDRERIEAFHPEPGEWLKVKLRVKGGVLRARTVRRTVRRDRFKLIGTIRETRPEGRLLSIGGFPLEVSESAKFRLLTSGKDDPLSLFLQDEQKGVPFTLRLHDRLRAGGEFSFKPEIRDEYDLDTKKRGDRISLKEDFKIDLLWRMSDGGAFALLEVSTGTTDRFREGSPDTRDDRASVSRAYAYLPLGFLGDGFRLQVGRQDFYEKREWLYDEVLDALRLLYRGEEWRFEGAVAAGREFLDDNNATKSSATYTALLAKYWDEVWRTSVYVLQRKDWTLANFEPFLFGLRSYAKRKRGFGHWVELGGAKGYHGTKRILGYAMDGGIMFRPDLPGRPTFVLGYALGTGSSNPAGREGYRQSGWQDNNGKFGGVTSFRYYGEVLEPELSNLQVLTIAVGARPIRTASVDLVFHKYRQHRPEAAFTGARRLKASPNGRSRELGWGLDCILGYRPSSRFSFELVAGLFDPSRAFNERNTAHKVELQLRLKF